LSAYGKAAVSPTIICVVVAVLLLSSPELDRQSSCRMAEVRRTIERQRE
jgi:hypothetical protein